MKLHEVGNLTGETFPKYLQDGEEVRMIKKLLHEFDNLVSSLYIENKENLGSIELNEISRLVHTSLFELVKKIYSVAKKSITINSPGTTLNRINTKNKSKEEKRLIEIKTHKRFSFLFNKFFYNGLGLGYRLDLNTFRDALRQDLQSNSPIILKYFKNINRRGEFNNPAKLYFELLEQHRTQIRIETKLNQENIMATLPTFLTNPDGSDFEFETPFGTGKLVEIDRPEILELITYLEDVCIGSDDMEYKKSLVTGEMKFLAIQLDLPKKVSLSNQISIKGNYNSIIPNYFNSLHKKEIQRLGELILDKDFCLTLSFYIDEKNKTIKMDQIKGFRDNLLGPYDEDLSEITPFFLNILLPKIIEEFKQRGYRFVELGNDLSKIPEISSLEQDEVFVVGKGVVEIDNLEESDSCILQNIFYTVPKDISKKEFDRLLKLPVLLNVSNIYTHKPELLESVTDASAYLFFLGIENIDLPNLKTSGSIQIIDGVRISLPNLVTQNLVIENNNGLIYLDLRSVKSIPNGIIDIDKSHVNPDEYEMEYLNLESLEVINEFTYTTESTNIGLIPQLPNLKSAKVLSIECPYIPVEKIKLEKLTDAPDITLKFKPTCDIELPKLTANSVLTYSGSKLIIPALAITNYLKNDVNAYTEEELSLSPGIIAPRLINVENFMPSNGIYYDLTAYEDIIKIVDEISIVSDASECYILNHEGDLHTEEIIQQMEKDGAGIEEIENERKYRQHIFRTKEEYQSIFGKPWPLPKT